MRPKRYNIPFAILSTVLFSSFLLAENTGTPQVAPLMPEMQREFRPGTGFVPPTLDLAHIKGQIPSEKLIATILPSQWDWREQGKVTSVKNQGSCGSCYSFAALANIEAKMLVDDAGIYDFSENNVKECNYYQTGCDGGNYFVVANWLSKVGTVLESCDPYVAANTSCNSTCDYIKTLLDWRIISGSSVPEDSVLKYYIYNYGPIYTTLYAGDGSDPSWESEITIYDGSYTLYYPSGCTPNHAVSIVGWNDTLTHTGGNGAWIVKNSWGTSWGGTCNYGSEAGYFTIAYGSAAIGQYSSFIYDWQNYDEDGEILYYDDGGWTNSFGYVGTTTGWGMCKFVPSTNTYLTNVEFWTTDITTDIDVYVYDSFDGTNTSSLLASKSNTSYDESGYHSVALDSPLELIAGNDIYVAMKITNQSYGYPVAIDMYYPVESSKTYTSSTGSNWYEMGSHYGYDVAIRARFGSGSGDNLTVTSPNGSEYWEKGSSHAITWTSSGSISNIKLEYSLDSGSSWLDIDSSTANDGSCNWILPDTTSTECLVKISDAADGDPSDISDDVFAICEEVQTVYVWPGDLNNDGIVDVSDIQPLALYWYETGMARDSVDYAWSAHSVQQWFSLSITYADADGSGRVDMGDFLPVCLNWNMTHSSVASAGSTIDNFDIEANRGMLELIYDQVKYSDSGARYEIKLYLENILGISLPEDFVLYQNYPNPFNSSTLIKYSLAKNSPVKLIVYDIAGRQIKVLAEGNFQAGDYEISWDGTNKTGKQAASGIYFYRLVAPGFSSVKKMIVTK